MKTLRFEPLAEPESPDWLGRMTQLGAILLNNKVRYVLFAHGTFVGDDPLGIISIFANVEHALGQLIDIDKLSFITKQVSDLLNQDKGNYTQKNLTLFKTGIGHKIDADRFIWSSGNFHMARLLGTVELAHCLAVKICNSNYDQEDRLLLMGHSHAGQLFALLTIFLEASKTAKYLLVLLDQPMREQLQKDLKIISGVNLDIVTFGTPVRYHWGNYDKYQLINIINDRNNHVVVDISGVLNTRDGDYVQHLGTEGTDLPSPDSTTRALNKELDEILANKGELPLTELAVKLKSHIRKEPSAPDTGGMNATFLVDYRDQADSIPNCVDTLFGHGCYTLRDALLFNTDLIVRALYFERSRMGN